MGPLALLGLAGGIGGLASLMKKKGIDLKKKKKKYKPEWQTEPDKKKVEEQRERAKKNKKRFLDKLKDLMN